MAVILLIWALSLERCFQGEPQNISPRLSVPSNNFIALYLRALSTTGESASRSWNHYIASANPQYTRPQRKCWSSKSQRNEGGGGARGVIWISGCHRKLVLIPWRNTRADLARTAHRKSHNTAQVFPGRKTINYLLFHCADRCRYCQYFTSLQRALTSLCWDKSIHPPNGL